MAQELQHLYRFVRTEAHWDWSSKEREAFEEAKVAVTQIQDLSVHVQGQPLDWMESVTQKGFDGIYGNGKGTNAYCKASGQSYGKELKHDNAF